MTPFSSAYVCFFQLRLEAVSRFSLGNAFLHTKRVQSLPKRRIRLSSRAKKVLAAFSPIKVDRGFSSVYRISVPQTKRNICQDFICGTKILNKTLNIKLRLHEHLPAIIPSVFFDTFTSTLARIIITWLLPLVTCQSQISRLAKALFVVVGGNLISIKINRDKRIVHIYLESTVC